MYDGVYFYCYNLTKGETMTKMPQEVIDLFNDTEVAYVVTTIIAAPILFLSKNRTGSYHAPAVLKRCRSSTQLDKK